MHALQLILPIGFCSFSRNSSRKFM